MTNQLDKEICEVIDRVGGRLNDQPVTPETYADQLAWDSLDQVEVIMAIEERFDIDLPDDITADFNKVSDLIQRVKNHMPEQVAHG